MKEFVEKLIGRFEELKSNPSEKTCRENILLAMQKNLTIYSAIEIVNQLAEEYQSRIMIDGQYCFQTCGANEHCKECNRLSNGSIDYYENYDCLAEEYNNDFCEWSKQGGYNFWLHKTSCGTEDIFDDSYVFCPYCGKKIKVVD